MKYKSLAPLNKHKNLTGGFTLIELLVAIFIMVILLLVSIPQFQHFGKKAQTQGTANELKSLIEKTRTYAMAPREQDTNILYYSIEINKNGKWTIQGTKIANQSIEIEKGAIDSRTEIEGLFYNNNDEISTGSVVLGFETPTGRAIQGLNGNKSKLDIVIKYKNSNIVAKVLINLITSQVEITEV